MLVGVLSDSHDNTENLQKALDEMLTQGVSTVLHLGDIVAPFNYYDVLKKYTSKMCFVMVFGNNDGEIHIWTRIAQEDQNIDLQGGDFRELELGGKKVFMTHYPQIAEIAALSGKYDAVFYGHTHIAKQKMIKDTLLANPGEILGLRTGRASYGLWDTEGNGFKTVYLDES